MVFQTGLSYVPRWLQSLGTDEATLESRLQYYAHNPDSLITSSTVRALHYSNGHDIYHTHLIPAIQLAEHEVILVTCYWAPSTSLSDLSSALVDLSQKALDRGTGEKIRVRLCFSSRSLLQKLFHTSSPRGCVYDPYSWNPQLGLPDPDQLCGLDLQVKSLFFRPFSVLHPKFIIVDRRLAYMPSCNISWEEWCECCVVLDGAFVERLADFWRDIWALDCSDTFGALAYTSQPPHGDFRTPNDGPQVENRTITLLLPSRHHSSPSQSLFFLSQAAPPTPLNTFLLTAFAEARRSILLLTPNLTSTPVQRALLAALTRGVDVHVITNRRMMVIEQLVTAGTLTEICVWQLVRAYRKLHRLENRRRESDQMDSLQRLERDNTPMALGHLKIQYYQALRSVKAHKLHIKCSVFDGELYIMGSGNMDRASWYTSQELGIGLLGDFANFIRDLKADLVLEDYFQ